MQILFRSGAISNWTIVRALMWPSSWGHRRRRRVSVEVNHISPPPPSQHNEFGEALHRCFFWLRWHLGLQPKAFQLPDTSQGPAPSMREECLTIFCAPWNSRYEVQLLQWAQWLHRTLLRDCRLMIGS